MLKGQIVTLALLGGLAFGQAPKPPSPPTPTPVAAPLPPVGDPVTVIGLTDLEKLKLENMQLKLDSLQARGTALAQQNAQLQQEAQKLVSDSKDYEKGVLDAHPGAKGKFVLSTPTQNDLIFRWQPAPPPPQPVATPKDKPIMPPAPVTPAKGAK